MKNRKCYEISLFVIFCITLNYAGKILAEALQLPVWMDAFGTVLAAYVLGPACGAMVGVSVNIIYGMIYSWTYMLYGLVSVIVGIIVGISAARKYMENLFGTLSLCFMVTILSVGISLPLNYCFFDGMTGNIWGDGVIEVLTKLGFHSGISHFAGQFYMDFLDKVFTIVVLFLCIRLYRRMREKKKNRKTAVGLLLFLFLMAGAGKVQADTVNPEEKTDYTTYIQTVYNRENGLPGGCANDIAQTADGILWIGTYGGLYRYNGNEFQWMDEFESVKTVNCLYTDEEGRLWIGTNDSGLSICINETITNVVSEKDGLTADSVRCITQSSDGDYYVGTSGAMSILTLAGGLSVKDTIPEIIYANSIDSDQNGNIAVVTDEGRLYLIRGKEILAELQQEEGENYTCCRFDEEGRLYVGTSGKTIEVYDCGEGLVLSERLSCEELNNIKSVCFQEDETLFLCADNGIAYFDGEGVYHMLNTDAFNSSIDHMIQDYQGNLWFTSSRLGLLRLCKSVFMEVYSQSGIEENVTNTVIRWNGKLYVGMDGGLEIVDEAANQPQHNMLTDMLDGVRIRCLFVDSRNHLWIATTGKGIYEILEDGQFQVYDQDGGTNGNKFRNIIELQDGTIAAAGDSGLTCIRDGNVVSVFGAKDGLRNPKILCLYEYQDGVIFAGTDGDGIARIKDGKLEKVYQKENGLGSDVILRMEKSTDGEGLFIVTGNSICYMDQNEEIRILDNFPYYNNYDVIHGNDGNLFVLSSAGIYVVDQNALISGADLEYKLLDAKSGLEKALTPNSWNYTDENGNLYLSTDSGVLCINLDNYEIAVRSYRMQIRMVKIDDEKLTVEREQEVYIERGAEKLEILPEIINYSVNTPYISIYLEGYDSEPRIVPQNELTSIVYAGLPVGTYTFRLAVLDSKARNTVVENSYTIIKEKEIYDNYWFAVYMVVVFAMAVAYLTWLFFRTQIQRTLNMQKKELELARNQIEMGNETVLTIARTVDAKDENTSQHSARVAQYSLMIARELGFDEQSCEELKRAALLHDIGKIGIPDSILNKPARLTDEEYKIMKSHVVKGGEILKNFTLIKNVEQGALYHHERYDGSGYVHGLKGEEIPLNARIIGIADAFDAMTANRVYRKKLDLDYVIGELKRGRGTQFDPKLTDIMLELIAKKQINVDEIYADSKKTEADTDEKSI